MVALHGVRGTIDQSREELVEKTLKGFIHFDYNFTSITLTLSEQRDTSLTVIQIAQTQHYSVSTALCLGFMG